MRIKLNAIYLVNKHDAFKCVSLKDCGVVCCLFCTYHFCPFCHEHEDLLQAPAALLLPKCDPPKSTRKIQNLISLYIHLIYLPFRFKFQLCFQQTFLLNQGQHPLSFFTPS